VLGPGTHYFAVEVDTPFMLDVHHLPIAAIDAPQIQLSTTFTDGTLPPGTPPRPAAAAPAEDEEPATKRLRLG
jgi:hypothetical protein